MFNPLFTFFLFIFGLFFGSFLNVVVYRLPQNRSFFGGRSKCLKCKKEIRWYDLVPVLSFVLLGGKCRYCKTSLSLQYPVVELLTGSLFALTYFFLVQPFLYTNLSLATSLPFYLAMISSLIVIFFIDLKHGIIPDKVLLFALLISAGYLLLNPTLILPHLAGGFIGFSFLLALFLGTKGRGMGFGDVKMAFVLGLFLGPAQALLSLYLAFLTGGIVSIILILWGKKRFFGDTIPFGPFLVIGAIMALFYGEIILGRIGLVLR